MKKVSSKLREKTNKQSKKPTKTNKLHSFHTAQKSVDINKEVIEIRST